MIPATTRALDIPASKPIQGRPVEGGPVETPSLTPYQQQFRGDIIPKKRYLKPDERSRLEDKRLDKYSLMDGLSAGLQLESSIGSGFRFVSNQMSKPDFEDVDGYLISAEDMAGYENYEDAFLNSGSPEESAWIRDRVDEENRLREAAGFTGMMFGAILTPENWLAGGISSFYKMGLKGIIATEVAGVALTEAQLQVQSRTRTALETSLNIASVGILVGILGKAGMAITKAERAAAEREIKAILKGEPETPKLDPDTGEIIPPTDTGGSAGAMSALGDIPDNTVTGFEFTFKGKKYNLAEMAGIGPGMRLLSSQSVQVREFIQKAVDMPFQLKKHLKGETVGVSVEARLGNYTKMWNKGYSSAKESFDTYTKAARKAGVKPLKWSAFEKEVGKAMRRGDTKSGSVRLDGTEDPLEQYINKSARAWRPLVDELRVAAQEVGALPQNIGDFYAQTYFPRMLDYNISDISPLTQAIAKHQMEKVGLPENEAWEVAEWATKRMSEGHTINPGVTPIPKASGTKVRSFKNDDKVIEDYLLHEPSLVFSRHFREMGAEIELRKMFGIDAASSGQIDNLRLDLEQKQLEHDKIIAREEQLHADIKLAEMQVASFDTGENKVAGVWRAWVMPGVEMELTNLPASAGRMPVVTVGKRKRGAGEVDLQVEKPIQLPEFGELVKMPSESGAEQLIQVFHMVNMLINARVMTKNFGILMDESIKALKIVEGKVLKADKDRMGSQLNAMSLGKKWDGRKAKSLAVRLRKDMIDALRKNGYDAIVFQDIVIKPKKGQKAEIYRPVEPKNRAQTISEIKKEAAAAKREELSPDEIQKNKEAAEDEALDNGWDVVERAGVLMVDKGDGKLSRLVYKRTKDVKKAAPEPEPVPDRGTPDDYYAEKSKRDNAEWRKEQGLPPKKGDADYDPKIRTYKTKGREIPVGLVVAESGYLAKNNRKDFDASKLTESERVNITKILLEQDDLIKRTKNRGTKMILFNPENATRAPTAAEKANMRRTLKRTMASHRKLMKRKEEFNEFKKERKELIKSLSESGEDSISKSVESMIDDVRAEYREIQSKLQTPAERDKVRKELNNVIRDIRAMIGRIQGQYGRPADPTNAWTRAGRYARATTAAASLGGVVVTSLAEIARPVFQYGLAPYAKGLATLVFNLKHMKIARKELQRLGSALEVVTSQRVLNILGDDIVGDMSKGQMVLEKGVGLATGLSHWTDAVKTLIGVIAVDETLNWMAKAAAGTITEMETSKLARAGISLDRAKQIYAQYKKFGDGDGPLKLAHTDDWADRSVALDFEAAIRSEVQMVSLEPGMGDKWLWSTGSEMGKLFGQFQAFSQGATNRALVSGLQRADTAFYQGSVLSVAMGAAVMTLKDLSLGKDPTDRNAGEVLRDSIDRSGITGVYSKVLQIQKQIQQSKNSASTGLQMATGMLGPTFGRAIPNAFEFAASAATPGQDVKWKKGLDVVPYNDLFHLRRVYEQTLGDE